MLSMPLRCCTTGAQIYNKIPFEKACNRKVTFKDKVIAFAAIGYDTHIYPPTEYRRSTEMLQLTGACEKIIRPDHHNI